MQTQQWGSLLLRTKIAEREHESVLTGLDLSIVEKLERRFGGGKLYLANTAHRMFLSVPSNRIDREQTQSPGTRNIKQHLPPCRLSILTQDLADDRTRLETSDTHEIDGCLGMAASLQGPTWLCPKREDVSRTHQIFWSGGGSNQGADRDCPVTC